MKDERIVLGSLVKDTTTGFTGIAVSRTSYLTGLDRIEVQPVCDNTRSLPPSENFDEARLQAIVPSAVERDIL